MIVCVSYQFKEIELRIEFLDDLSSRVYAMLTLYANELVEQMLEGRLF